jgi:predicted nucleotidyltransferase
MAGVSRAEALQAELERFIAVAAADPQVRQVLVFGSMATGTLDEWSDLDLVVVTATD